MTKRRRCDVVEVVVPISASWQRRPASGPELTGMQNRWLEWRPKQVQVPVRASTFKACIVEARLFSKHASVIAQGPGYESISHNGDAERSLGQEE